MEFTLVGCNYGNTDASRCVLAALSQIAHRILMPLMDFMQTMPAFVYLIPAISFFELGVSAIFSTVIFSMPPARSETCLGLCCVPNELIEAADAFGSRKRQKLFKLQLPLAMPTISYQPKNWTTDINC